MHEFIYKKGQHKGSVMIGKILRKVGSGYQVEIILGTVPIYGGWEHFYTDELVRKLTESEETELNRKISAIRALDI